MHCMLWYFILLVVHHVWLMQRAQGWLIMHQIWLMDIVTARRLINLPVCIIWMHAWLLVLLELKLTVGRRHSVVGAIWTHWLRWLMTFHVVRCLLSRIILFKPGFQSCR